MGKQPGLSFRDFATDGASRTILLVEAGPDRAVPWTKPEDLSFDPKNPIAALGKIPGDEFKALYADGNAVMLAKDIDAATLKNWITHAGRELVDRPDRPPVRQQRRTVSNLRMLGRMLGQFGISQNDVDESKIIEFVRDGIGDQIGFHVCDAKPTFDFSLPRFLGAAFSMPRGFSSYLITALPLVSSLNAPVYLAIPVKDEQIVDQFLARLDSLLAKAARRPVRAGFFSAKTDFYHLPEADTPTRCLAVEYFSFRFRFFIARIDKGLFIATQPSILQDLAEQAAPKPQANPDTPPDSSAHLLVRIRPQNWRQVLANYQLGWAEANRESCLKNLGPLIGIARGYGELSSPALSADGPLHGVRYYCPEGGRYVVSFPKTEDGSQRGCDVHCTLHGSAEAPRQTIAPATQSPVRQTLAEFGGLTAALTFTDDGLRAVLRIDRIPAKQ